MLNAKLAFDVQVMQKIIQSIGRIDSFKGRWAGIESRNDLQPARVAKGCYH